MDVKATPYSNLKIFAHPDKLSAIKNNERVSPIYIRIKPTNKCNHNCHYCHYKNPYLNLDEYNPNDYIPKQKMVEIIKDISDIGVKAVTFSGGGEPLIYPYISETMEMVLNNNIDLSIITNGSELKGKNASILSKAKWVRISLDSSNNITYSKIRGIKEDAFNNLCDNIEKFSSIKDNSCELGINFVIGSDNFKEVYNCGKLMKNLGVNHIKFTAKMSNNAIDEQKTLKKEVIQQINQLSDTLQDNNFKIINLYESDLKNDIKFERNYTKCYIKEYICVIAANSKVYYCHDKAYLSDGQIGDLSVSTFKDLWFSNKTSENFNKFNALQQCKHHCVYDERNQLLNSFFSLNENHINFI